MKHVHLDMKFNTLVRRADEILTLDSVCDYLGGDDLREVTVFMEHEQSSHGYGDDQFYRLEGKEIIGVAFCDLDDPLAAIEVLDRNQAVDLFGWKWVADRECME